VAQGKEALQKGVGEGVGLAEIDPRPHDQGVGGDEAEQVVRDVSYQLHSYFDYRVVGSVFFNSATPPCFICGYGTTCQYGGPARWMSPEEFDQFTEITPEMFQNFEDHPEVVQACELLSQELNRAIAAL
jgi:hypothetical protein